MRAHHYTSITVNVGGGSRLAEVLEKYRLSKKLDPVPLVWIANPVDSGPLELQRIALSKEKASNRLAGPPESEVGFRVESGATWQSDVRALIAAASFIVVHNPEMTPGVTAEVEIVKELGRLEDTFFYSPEKAAAIFTDPSGPVNSLTEERIKSLRETARGRMPQPGALPAATCAWTDGPRKQRIETEVRAISRWVKRLAQSRSTLSTDLELDGYYY